MREAFRSGVKIAAGFEADLILVPANPPEDIAALQDVSPVNRSNLSGVTAGLRDCLVTAFLATAFASLTPGPAERVCSGE